MIESCSRIRGAALRVVSLRRSAPARSPSNSRKLIGEFDQCFPTLLGRYPRSHCRAQTTTVGRKPTRQCFCVRCLLERHGVSRERLQGRCEVPDRRRKPTHQPVRRGSKATSRALYGMSQGNRWLGFPLLRDLALPGYRKHDLQRMRIQEVPMRTSLTAKAKARDGERAQENEPHWRRSMEIAWLVEREGPLSTEFLYCWSGGFEWTNDSLKAIRFCRREDANQVAEIFEFEDVHIREHQWG